MIEKGPIPANMSMTTSPGWTCLATMSRSVASLGEKKTFLTSILNTRPYSLCVVSVVSSPATTLRVRVRYSSLTPSSTHTVVTALWTAMMALPICSACGSTSSSILTSATEPRTSYEDGSWDLRPLGTSTRSR